MAKVEGEEEEEEERLRSKSWVTQKPFRAWLPREENWETRPVARREGARAGEGQGGVEGKRPGGIGSFSKSRRNFKCPNLNLSCPVCFPGTEASRTACAEEKSMRGSSCLINSVRRGCPLPGECWPEEGAKKGGGREGGRETGRERRRGKGSECL